MTPNDPGWFSIRIIFVEGVKLELMYKSRVNATLFKGVEAFVEKLNFDLCDPYVTFDTTLVIWHKCYVSGALVTKFGWNRSMHVEAISLRSVARRRKKERRHEKDSRPCRCLRQGKKKKKKRQDPSKFGVAA